VAGVKSAVFGRIGGAELARMPYTFPFDLLPFMGEIRRSERFEVTRQGLDLDRFAPTAI
jgi:hypothetical protein